MYCNKIFNLEQKWEIQGGCVWLGFSQFVFRPTHAKLPTLPGSYDICFDPSRYINEHHSTFPTNDNRLNTRVVRHRTSGFSSKSTTGRRLLDCRHSLWSSEQNFEWKYFKIAIIISSSSYIRSVYSCKRILDGCSGFLSSNKVDN